MFYNPDNFKSKGKGGGNGGGGSLIPDGTKAKVRMQIIKTKQGSRDPFLHPSKTHGSNLHSLQFKVMVISDPLKGKTFYHNFAYGIPDIKKEDLNQYLTDGQMKAVDSGHSLLKSCAQSARNINPRDQNADLGIRGFQGYNNLVFAAFIKIEEGNGKYKPKNKIRYAIHNYTDDYQQVMSGVTILPDQTQQNNNYGSPPPPQQNGYSQSPPVAGGEPDWL